MRERMTTQIAVSTEYLAAGVAFVGLVISMCQKMRLEIGALVKAASANWAFMGTFFHMKDFVDGQSSGLAESFATLCTFEGLFLGMYISETNKEKDLVRILS